ncbi:MAG: cytochrome b N-terminal domain-containing protein [Candidatus Velthaea sp.]|jgi:ubiquinol-cytochrome c reductase cytochrome b subunit
MLSWLDQRTGIVTQLNEFLTEDVPGGASYWYAFGSATVFAMILQIVTGIFLCFYYAPSATTAWESTKFLMEKVPFGHLVLSLHYWGASAMIAFMAMHLLQVLLWGAYKKPRELQWIVGVILFIITLVLGLTGYLLPWDLDALLASKVAIAIAGNAPVLGPAILNFLQDGNGIGTLTINRFFGLHVWLMPALLVGLVVMHLLIFRWNGAAGPPIDTAPKLKPGRFWPDQMFMDTVVSFAMFVVIVVLAIFSPAVLDAKADPNNTQFVAYPAWYFMALYALLDVVGTFPPAIVQTATLLASIVGPGLLVLVLILLPFIDKNPSRKLTRRPWVLGLTALVMLGAIGFSFVGQYNVEEGQLAHGLIDSSGNPIKAAVAATATTTATATGGASGATAAGGGAAGSASPAVLAAGKKVYDSSCAGCHGATGQGQPTIFPNLAGNAYVTGDPKLVIHAISYGLNGPIKVGSASYNGLMPAWQGNLTNAEIASVTSYIRNAWGNKGSTVTTADVAAVKK